MTIELGRLKRVEARDVWANEAAHFTPWLAEEHNLALLGEALGIDLEWEATEKSVGPFSADILCKDTANETLVLIENQLERTDHKHLGQLITYASGLKAATIVWIANPFTAEHRAALDWLNQITDTKFNFFGLEVELWQIGDSIPAPKFNVISKPNNWSKTVSEGVASVEREGLTTTKQLQLEFWTHFQQYATDNAKAIKSTNPRPQHWMTMSIGRSGFNLTAIASLWSNETQSYSKSEIRVQIEMHNKNAKDYYERLIAQQEQIEFELGFPVFWFNDPSKVSCKIVASKTVDINDRSDWDDQCAWLVTHLDDLHRVFWHRIRDL